MPQAVVMLWGRGQPDAVIARIAWFVAEGEHDSVFDINGHATEQRPGPGRGGRKCVQNERMGNRLPLLERKHRIGATGRTGALATSARHVKILRQVGLVLNNVLLEK